MSSFRCIGGSLLGSSQLSHLGFIVMMWGIFLYFTTVDLPSGLEIGAAVLVITAYVIFDHFDGLQAD